MNKDPENSDPKPNSQAPKDSSTEDIEYANKENSPHELKLSELSDNEKLADEALGNIREDREQTKDLLRDLIKYLGGAEDRHRDVALTAAKYVETLQRSNEQLVKIAALKQKTEKRKPGGGGSVAQTLL